MSKKSTSYKLLILISLVVVFSSACVAVLLWKHKYQEAGKVKIEELKKNSSILFSGPREGTESHEKETRSPESIGVVGTYERKRKILSPPIDTLLQPDYDDKAGVGHWSTLSVMMAGFAVLSLINLLKEGDRFTAEEKNRDSYLLAISGLFSALFLFIIAGDLFTWVEGDKIEIRGILQEMAANFIVATALLCISFSLNHVGSLLVKDNRVIPAARKLFWGVLLYNWALVIPTAGCAINEMTCYKDGYPAFTVLTELSGKSIPWYADYFFLILCLPFGLPVIALILKYWCGCWSEEMEEKLSYYAKPKYVASIFVCFGLLLGFWLVVINHLVHYTGDPTNPVIIEQVEMLAPPYLTQGILFSLYGLISTFLAISLPREKI